MNHMDEMGIETVQWVNLPICDRVVSNEISGEYSLPDDQPEIRRLLSVIPTVMPPAKYVGNTQIEWSGTVDYQVMYVGADGGIYSVPLSSEYHTSLPIEASGEIDLGAGVLVFVTPTAETVTTRVSAPRKLSIRCRVRCRVCAYGKMPLEERCRGSAPLQSLRRRMLEGGTMRALCALSEMMTLHEEIGGIGEGVRVISASAVPFVQDVRMSGEGMCVSGEVLLKLMICSEDIRIETLSRKLPFAGNIDLDENIDAQFAVASGTVGELTVSVEDGRILCDLELLLEGRARQNRAVSYTADLYSTAVESECRVTEYMLPVVCKCENTNLSQSERLSASEYKLDEGTQILDVWCGVLWERCENEEGKYVLIGQSRYTLLCQKEGEFSTVDVILPLRYETEASERDAVGFDARADLLWCRARLEGDLLSLDSELSVMAEFFGEASILPVCEVEFGETVPTRPCGMTVYYPAPEETVWDVAKKYRISLDALTKKQGKVAYYLF